MSELQDLKLIQALAKLRGQPGAARKIAAITKSLGQFKRSVAATALAKPGGKKEAKSLLDELVDLVQVSAELAQLRSEHGSMSQTSRLRKVYRQVRLTLDAGVHWNDVLVVLQKHGFEFTENSLKSAMQRIKKEEERAELSDQ